MPELRGKVPDMVTQRQGIPVVSLLRVERKERTMSGIVHTRPGLPDEQKYMSLNDPRRYQKERTMSGSVVVTDKMREAGNRVVSYWHVSPQANMAEQIYKAMHALSPAPAGEALADDFTRRFYALPSDLNGDAVKLLTDLIAALRAPADKNAHRE